VKSNRALAPALLLVALNLRLAIAAVPPVLTQIRHSTGLGSAGGGLLTALPVFCFGAFALATPKLIRRFGMRPLLSLVLVAILAGTAVRLLTPVVALFLGTAIIGSGIAVGNVLVPSLLRRDFADRRVMMLAFYSLALFIGGGLSAGLTVPLKHATGLSWRVTVALWGLAGLLAFAIWAPHALRERRREDRAEVAGEADVAGDQLSSVSRLWRDPLAWCVTLFMGLQSLSYYSTLSWIPTLLENHGLSAGKAGWLLSFSMFPGMLAALSTPALERRARRPAVLVLVTVALCGGAYAGLLAAPASATYVWMTLLGLGQGVSLSLALGYIVARAPDSHHAAHLSTMAQSVGYMLAAAGPFMVGALHGATGGWTLPMLVLIVLLAPLLIAGLVASQDRHVLAPRDREPELVGR
jgi:CP family cyanate transporter-like MFS transporter